MAKVQIGDVVILSSGVEVQVTQVAEEDSLFEFRAPSGWTGWTDESLVEWNKTETEWATLDSELTQDYT